VVIEQSKDSSVVREGVGGVAIAVAIEVAVAKTGVSIGIAVDVASPLESRVEAGAVAGVGGEQAEKSRTERISQPNHLNQFFIFIVRLRSMLEVR
jgi:hypothetical protein